MLGDNIKRICKEKGIRQKELAEQLAVAKTTVSMWITNQRVPDIDTIKKIATILQVSVNELIDAPTPNAVRVEQDSVRMIPVFENVSAGFGAFAQDSVVDYIPLYIPNASEAAETICVRVCGDSMHPKIEDGDLVQVHKQETAENGDIVVILDGSEAYVKRFLRTPHGVVLESVNPAYAPMRYTREESNDLRIVGVVKRIVREL